MTDEVEQLLRVFISEVEGALETAARFLDLAEAGTLPASDAKHAAENMRTLAGQARWIQRFGLPPAAPRVM